MRKRRRSTEEFQQQARGLASQPNATKRQIAGDLGIDTEMLGRWCRGQQAHGLKVFSGHGNAREEAVAPLERALARAKQERDFFKEKTAAFFTQESQ